jgi:hypothetical protein
MFEVNRIQCGWQDPEPLSVRTKMKGTKMMLVWKMTGAMAALLLLLCSVAAVPRGAPVRSPWRHRSLQVGLPACVDTCELAGNGVCDERGRDLPCEAGHNCACASGTDGTDCVHLSPCTPDNNRTDATNSTDAEPACVLATAATFLAPVEPSGVATGVTYAATLLAFFVLSIAMCVCVCGSPSAPPDNPQSANASATPSPSLGPKRSAALERALQFHQVRLSPLLPAHTEMCCGGAI